MLQRSSQIQIIESIVKGNPKVFKGYNSIKFETFTASEFKLLILTIIYKTDYTLPKLIKYLNNTNTKELKEYLSIIDEIQTLCWTLRKDKEKVGIIKGLNNILNADISLLSKYNLLKDIEIRNPSRLQQKKIQKIHNFMDKLPILKQRIEDEC